MASTCCLGEPAILSTKSCSAANIPGSSGYVFDFKDVSTNGILAQSDRFSVVSKGSNTTTVSNETRYCSTYDLCICRLTNRAVTEIQVPRLHREIRKAQAQLQEILPAEPLTRCWHSYLLCCRNWHTILCSPTSTTISDARFCECLNYDPVVDCGRTVWRLKWYVRIYFARYWVLSVEARDVSACF
jgi:hypothetical protein